MAFKLEAGKKNLDLGLLILDPLLNSFHSPTMLKPISLILCSVSSWISLSNAAEKNVIFFITDDESPTLGCYGDPIAKTPAIDALAKDGTVFENAFATTASCSASRSVVMSGLHNPVSYTHLTLPTIKWV